MVVLLFVWLVCLLGLVYWCGLVGLLSLRLGSHVWARMVVYGGFGGCFCVLVMVVLCVAIVLL